MKKLVSAMISVLLCIGIFAAATSYAADKKYAEQVLEQIQTQEGFIPGETAAVTGNCYGFIAAVCEKLYGVSYNGEELYDSYQCRHRTGNYYTVATHTNGATADANTVNGIIDFFLENAYPGDIVHYGSLTSSGSRHTIMIQSIDGEKMRFFHANYQTRQYASSACHIDTVYWDSMRENFTSAVYTNSGELYSHNSIFYNKMKNGGLGITINRFTDYNTYFYPAGASASAVPQAETVRASGTSVKVKWNPINGAAKYEVQYRVKNTGDYQSASAAVKGTQYTVKGLTAGKTYQFRVRASIGGSWADFSNAVEQQVLAPAVTKITFGKTAEGITLQWKAMTDITGVKVYRATEPDGLFRCIATLTDNAGGSSYTDSGVKYDTVYYYKLERFVKVGSKSYTALSEPFSASYTLKQPTLWYHRVSATSVKVGFKGDGCESGFEYYLVRDNKTVVKKTFTAEKNVTLEQLEQGAEYTFFCREKSAVGAGNYTVLSFVPMNPKVTQVNAKAVTDGVLLTYAAQSDAVGYYIYRSSTRTSGYQLIGTVKSGKTNTFTDKTVKYNRSYYYKVKAYSYNRAGEAVAGCASAATAKLTYCIAVPQQVKTVRVQPDTIRLSWQAVSNAAYYKVAYQKDGGSWQYVNKIRACQLDIAGLTLGEKYNFKVFGVNRFGHGEYCQPVSKTMLPPALKAPKATSVANGIKVSWRSVRYASSYRIYRSDSKNGTYRLLAVVNGASRVSYVDETAVKGKGYYYRVACSVAQGTRVFIGAKSAAAYAAKQ